MTMRDASLSPVSLRPLSPRQQHVRRLQQSGAAPRRIERLLAAPRPLEGATVQTALAAVQRACAPLRAEIVPANGEECWRLPEEVRWSADADSDAAAPVAGTAPRATRRSGVEPIPGPPVVRRIAVDTPDLTPVQLRQRARASIEQADDDDRLCAVAIVSDPVRDWLYLSLSPLLADGRSAELIARELMDRATGRVPDAVIDAVPYSVILDTVQGLVRDGKADAGVLFWASQIGDRALRPLPYARQEAGAHRFETLVRHGAGLTVPRRLARHADRVAAIEALALTCWSCLCARHLGTDDVTIGVAVDGRSGATLETIGPLAATLPLAVSIDGREPIAATAQRLSAHLASARAWQFVFPWARFDALAPEPHDAAYCRIAFACTTSDATVDAFADATKDGVVEGDAAEGDAADARETVAPTGGGAHGTAPDTLAEADGCETADPCDVRLICVIKGARLATRLAFNRHAVTEGDAARLLDSFEQMLALAFAHTAQPPQSAPAVSTRPTASIGPSATTARAAAPGRAPRRNTAQRTAAPVAVSSLTAAIAAPYAVLRGSTPSPSSLSSSCASPSTSASAWRSVATAALQPSAAASNADAADLQSARRETAPPLVTELFDRQVLRTPDAIAAATEDDHLTYAGLHRRASAVARALRSRGAGPETRIGLLMPRSSWTIVAVLGVLKSGAAFVPLDGAPRERVRRIVVQCTLRVILVEGEEGESRCADLGAELLRPSILSGSELSRPARSKLALSHHRVLPAGDSAAGATDRGARVSHDGAPGVGAAAPRVEGGASAEQLAYVLFTSGSTGEPKGVMVPHGSLARYLAWARGAYDREGTVGSVLHSPLDFDFTMTALFLPLITGRTVLIAPEEPTEFLARALSDLRPLTFVKLSPAHLRALRDLASWHPLAAAQLVIGGEALLPQDLRPLADAAYDIVNEYGPTEATVGCCVYRGAAQALAQLRDASVPIGRPIDGVTLHLLARDGTPAVPGAEGALAIGGRTLARGYAGRPDLTADAFRPDPSAAAPGARIYRTGDRARLLPDDELIFLGREDGQIKLNGFRVELDEIGAVAREMPGVTQAVAFVWGDERDAQRLALAVVLDPRAVTGTGAAPLETIRTGLAERLPAHARPARVMLVDAIPLTAHAKIDRRALARWMSDAVRVGARSSSESAGGAAPSGAAAAGAAATGVAAAIGAAAATSAAATDVAATGAAAAGVVRGATGIDVDLRRDAAGATAFDASIAHSESVAPAVLTPAERDLAEMWRTVLKADAIGVDDNFFAAGGDSIRSIQLLGLAKRRGYDLSLSEILEAPTIRQLARRMRRGASDLVPAAMRVPFALVSEADRARLPDGLDDAYPMTSMQEGMLFHSEWETGTATYHDCVGIHLEAPFDRRALRACLQAVAAVHPVLRTRFDVRGFDEPLQLVRRVTATAASPSTLPSPSPPLSPSPAPAPESLLLAFDATAAEPTTPGVSPLAPTASPWEPEYDEHDLRALDPASQEQAIRDWMIAEPRRPFDWSQSPPYRCVVHRRGPSSFQFSIVFHHALLDGWSTATLLVELLQRYAAALGLSPAALAPSAPPAQSSFRDYVYLERRARASAATREFWRVYLQDDEVQPLSYGRTLPAREREVYTGVRRHERPIDAETGARASALARELGVPLKSVLLAAHLRVIGALANRTAIVCGVVSNGRVDDLDGERALGLFLNTLPVRARLERSTWRGLIRDLHAHDVRCAPHRRFPIAEILRLVRTPDLFDTAFNFVHYHLYRELPPLPGIRVRETYAGEETSFALLASFVESGASDRLTLLLDLDTARVPASRAAAIADLYEQALQALTEQPDAPVLARTMLSPADEAQLRAWSMPAGGVTRESAFAVDGGPSKSSAVLTRHEQKPAAPAPIRAERAVVAQARTRPDAVAMVAGEQHLSYGVMLARARQVAGWMARRGIGPESVVALDADRSLDLTIVCLGTLLAGAAYVHVDGNLPETRRRFVLQDCRPALVVRDSARADARDEARGVDRNGHRGVARDGDGDTAVRPEASRGVSPDIGGDVERRDSSSPATLTADALLESARALASHAPPFRLPRTADLDSPCYLVYTSGSTGQPKGIVMPHRPVAALVQWQVARTAPPPPRTLQYTTFSFDVSFQELFTTWGTGGTLVLVSDDLVRDPARLWELICREQAERLFMPGTALRQLAAVRGTARESACPSLYDVLIGGSALQLTADLRAFFSDHPRARLTNQYGPGETHVITWDVAEGPSDAWPDAPGIGRPIAAAIVSLLDRDLRPAPIGTAAELHVGGDALARGYAHRPDLTAERFIPDPRSERAGARLYRSGDLARFDSSGTLEFLGRTDHQVKVLGHRVELEEIEIVLRQIGEIAEAVVEARRTADGETQLVAYLVPRSRQEQTPDANHADLDTGSGTADTDTDTAADRGRDGDRDADAGADADASASASAGAADTIDRIARQLDRQLPRYMRPSRFILLRQLPRTVTGKIDRRGLPRVEGRERPRLAPVPPATETEALVLDLWKQTLQTDALGVEDDFFDAGGHSLTATRIVVGLRAALRVDLPVRAVFELRTVRAMARALGDCPPVTEAVARIPRDGDLQLAPQQENWWYNELLTGRLHPHTIHFARHLRGPIDIAAIDQALAALQRRHEALRTAIVPAPTGEGRVLVDAPDAVRAPLRLSVVDLSPLSAAARADALRSLSRRERERPFDLAGGVPCRMTLIRLAPDDQVLLFTMHHLLSDEWSVDLLSRECSALYAAFRAGRPLALPELPFQYVDFARWQRDWLASERARPQLDYWRRQLSPPLRHLWSADGGHDAASTYLSVRQRRSFELSEASLRAARRLAADERCTLFAVMLAALKLSLFAQTRQADVRVGIATANRELPGAAQVVGLFSNVACLRTRVEARAPIRDMVRAVQTTIADAAARQDLPFEILAGVLRSDALTKRGAASSDESESRQTDPNRTDVGLIEPRQTDRRQMDPRQMDPRQTNLQASAPEADRNHADDDAPAPLFQVLVLWQAVAAEPLRFAGVESSVYWPESDEAAPVLVRNALDLKVELRDTPGRLEGRLTYNGSRFTVRQMQALIDTMDGCLQLAASDASITVAAACERSQATAWLASDPPAPGSA